MKLKLQSRKYIKIDLERALLSNKFALGIFGVIAILFWGSFSCNNGILGNSIIFLIWWSTYSIRYIFVMLFCSVPYTGCFCEDLEYGYIRQEVIRGHLIDYCISKVLAIVISSIGVMVIGMGSFVLILRLFIPWVDLRNSVYLSAIHGGSFHNVILHGHYFIYSLLVALQFGLLTAILALTSACISLFVSNKLLVWSIPLIAYYLISQYSWTIFAGNSMADLDIIFSGRYNIFNNDIISFLYAVIVAFAIILLLTFIIYKKLKRRISCD